MVKNVFVIILATILLAGTILGGVMLYPQAKDGIVPEGMFTNDCEYDLKVGETLALTYSYDEKDARVIYSSSDESVITVTEDGTATAIAEGVAALNITVRSDIKNTRYVYAILVNVSAAENETEDVIYGKNYFDASYETNSYMYIGESIKLNCSYINDAGERLTDISFKSNDEKLASVDENGYVKGIKAGYTTVTATCVDNGKTFDFGVTVLKKNISAGALAVLKNHNSNLKVTYNLGIGDGIPAYYYDVIESVNNMFFDPLKVDKRYYDVLQLGEKNDGPFSEVQFITVHYTGNMVATADADNNADYFNYLGYSASIHFVTGRSNADNGYWSKDKYFAFAVLNEKYMGWHAGSHGLADPTFRWLETNVPCTDPDTAPVICVNKDGKFSVNGYDTKLEVPSRTDWAEVVGPTYVTNGNKYNTFDKQGIAWKVENGTYKIAYTYWNSQYQYTLSNAGGNYASIGIESCVDEGSDLVHTWHVTAQLVASLVKKYGLDLNRVQGHHFFSGKDCPQPLLENDMDLWNNMFMKYVEAEYDLLTRYSKYDFDYEAGYTGGILDDYGICSQDGDTHCVTYTVTVKYGTRTETIKLSSILESNQKRPVCESGCESLQQQGREII